MRGLIRWLVGHPTTVWIAATAVFLFGLLSYTTLPRESSPDITIPVIIVSTPYVGVSPEDIETLISVPMENELASLRNIKEMRSTSAEGISIVVLEFEPETVVEDALQRVRDRVGRVRPTLPEDAEEPAVREISFSDIPVVLITLAGDVGEDALKALAEELQDEITRIDGVLDVDLTGGTEREVQVQVLPERLAHYGLTLSDLTGAIGDENVNIPGGNVDVGMGNFLLRVPGEFNHPSEIGNVAIKRVGDRPVFVRDVARVIDGYEERETYSRMGGQASVTLGVKKRAGSNILRVASEAKALTAAHAESWPPGVTWRALGDESKYIDQMVSELQNNIITALILVVAVIIFFLGFRPSAFVAVSIPLSMLASMMVLDLLGFTLNMIVLFSLILALGMLVDNAIVVVENVYRHKEMGKDNVEAAIEGTSEVAVAVAASTATTVAAFFPLVFWTGIMGEFMGFLPKTVIIVLIMSLVMAVGVLPVVMSQLMPATVGADDSVRSSGDLRDAELGTIMGAYRALLRWSIARRYLSAAAVAVTLVATFVIYGFLNHGTEFFPATDPDRAIVGVNLPQGTGVETTDKVVRAIEKILITQGNVDTWVADVGVSASGDALSGSSASPNEARITVDFLADRNTAARGERTREEPSSVTVDRLRGLVAEIPGATISVEPQEMGPPVGKPINIEISGDDYDQVGEIAVHMRREIERTVPGVADLEDDYGVGRPELQLRIDRGAAKRIGVSTAEVGNAVRSAVAGAVATTLRDGEDEIDVVVELAPEYREDLQKVLTLRLPGREDTSPDTFPVPLSTVASYDFVGGSSGINHIDQDLVVTISGDVAEGVNENEVRAAVQDFLAGYELPAGVSTSLTGANEEQDDAMVFLIRAFFIAVSLILLVLVTQFDSITLPIIIVATVVLSLIGVLWGLMLTGTPFGIIMTGIGVISLAGVVVNNAIVLLDYVQQLRARGLSVEDSLVEAGLTRFRPVILTAITTALGLVPMAIGTSFDFTRFRLIIGSSMAQWWGPMAIAVIFGLTFATVLTLVMVPTLYSISVDLQKLRIGSRLGLRSAAAGTTAVALLVLLAVPRSANALTLQEAWSAAQDNDLTLALAREDAVQVGTLRGKAWSTLSPKLSASADYVINNQEIAFPQDPFLAQRTLGPAINDLNEIHGIEDRVGTQSCPPDVFPAPNGLPQCLVDPVELVIQEKTFLQGSARLTQRLFSGSALPALRAANQLHAAGLEDLRAAGQRSRANVARAFYGLLAAQQAIEVSETGLEIATSQLDLASRRFEAGFDDKRGKVQAQLGVSRAERDLQSAREALLDAQTAFELLTGLDGSDLELPEPFAIPADIDGALAAARTVRPDLLAADHRVAALKAQRLAQDLRWMPVLDGSGTVSWTENTGFNDQNFTWSVALSASWELWDGGLRMADRRETASQARAATIAKNLAVRQADREIRLAFEAHRRAEEAMQAMGDELALAAEGLELAERSFKAGGATWLELEQARLAYESTQLSELRERTARDLAAIDLLVRTGTL